jgi:tetratricopeptide (TPR) repeat protein
MRHWLAGEPVSAWKEPLSVRARRWLARHRTLAAAGLAALAVAVVSLATATVLLSRANERERQQRDRAQANFALARDAVDRYCTKVGNDPRLKEKDLEELRRQLLRTAAEFYETFVEQEQDDPDLRAELGRAHRRLAYITDAAEGPRQATACCENSIQVLEALCAEKPGEPDYRHELAQSHASLGSLLRDLGDFPGATSAYARARDLCAALVRDHPGKSEYALRLGNVHSRFGFLARFQGRHEEGVEHFSRAIRILESVKDRESDDDCLGELADANEGLATCLRRLGRRREAEAACLAGLPLREKLLERHAGQPLYQSGLANTLTVLGMIQNDGPDAKKCLATYEKALKLARQLAAGHPNVAWYQRDLATLLGNMALVHRRQADLDKTQRLAAEAVGILEKLDARYPEVPDYRAGLFLQHANRSALHMDAGRWDACAEELRRAKTYFDKLTGYPKGGHRGATLALNYTSLGRMYLVFGQPGPAREAFREAEELLRNPETRDRPGEGLPSLVRAFSALGQYDSQTGRHERAAAAYSQAIAAKKRIPPRPANERGGKTEGEIVTVNVPLKGAINKIEEPPVTLPDLYTHLGGALEKSGRAREAVAALEQAILEREKLRAAEPAKPHHSVALANDRLNLADAHRVNKQPEKAAAALREAASTLDRVGQGLRPESPEQALGAFVQGRLGDAWMQRGDRFRAEKHHRIACARYEKVVAHHPGVAEYQDHFAAVENNLAVLAFKAGDYPATIAIIGKAVDRLAALARKHPEAPSYRVGLANARINRGAAEHNIGLLDEALEDDLEAFELLKRVDLTDRIAASHAANLGRNSRNLSHAFAGRRRFREAIASAACSADAARLLHGVHPGEAQYHSGLARALLALATTLAQSGQPAGASLVLREAKDVVGPMDGKDANAEQAQRELGDNLHTLGLAWTRADEPDQAVSAFRDAVALRTRLANRWFSAVASRLELAQSLGELARVQERRGRLDESAESVHRALGWLARLSAGDRPVAWELVQLGMLSKKLGDAQEARGNSLAVLRARLDCLTAWRQVSAANPGEKLSALELALAHAELGGVLWRAKQLRAAREQLDQAAKGLNRILKLEGGNQRARGGLALTLMFQAIVNALEGKHPAALRTFQQAVQVQEKLVAEDPRSVEPRRQLAGIYANLAQHHKTRNEPREAVEALRKRVAHLEAVAAMRRQPLDQAQLAQAETHLADSLIDAGQLVQAGRAIRKAQAGLAPLPSSGPVLARVEVGRVLSRLARALEAVNPDRALAAFEEARRIEERVFSGHPRTAEFAVNLIGTYCNTGHFVRSRGKPESALGWYDRAIRTFAALDAAQSREARARLFLRNTRWGRAQALEQLKRYEEAAADWGQAVRLDAGPERAGFGIRRARCLARAGRHERAAAEAEKLARRPGTRGANLHGAACVLALASRSCAADATLPQDGRKKRAEKHATRAVELLLRARESGWFAGRSAVEGLLANEDLSGLRKREDFKKLLEDLEKR